MAWTTQQKNDLNNSMSAAQNVSLGTVVDALVTQSAIKIASETLTMATNPQTVVTGLSGITSAVASLTVAPTLTKNAVIATSGSVAGTLVLTAYMPTNASTVTPIASTASAIEVEWVAVGT